MSMISSNIQHGTHTRNLEVCPAVKHPESIDCNLAMFTAAYHGFCPETRGLVWWVPKSVAGGKVRVMAGQEPTNMRTSTYLMAPSSLSVHQTNLLI